MKNRILESFNATRGLQEDELDIENLYNDPEAEGSEESDAPLDVVDGDLETNEEGAEKSYVGRYVATCPVCAEPFFCSEEAQIVEGMCHDVCPVCQEEVDAQVIGVVSALEEEPTEEPEGEDGEDAPTEEGEPKEDPEEDPEEPVEEGVEKKPEVCEKCGKDPCECKDQKPASLEFDESTMDNLLGQFVQENYSSTLKSITVEGVKRNKRSLTIEAKATYNKGKVKPVNFVVENFKIGRKMTLEVTCKELGIVEKPMTLEARLKGGAIVVESMKYDYITKVMVEGKARKAQIVGSHSVLV